MNAITNKPELDPFVIYRDDKLDRVHEVKRYGVYALKMIGYGTVQLVKGLGETALVMDELLQSSINPTPDDTK